MERAPSQDPGPPLPGTPLSPFDVAGFLERIATGRSVLMLDYDGTLAPFRQDPTEAHPYPGVSTVLSRLNALATCRLVLVTGRPAEDVARLAGVSPQPEIWGNHGWERRLPDGTLSRLPIGEDRQTALDEALAAIPAPLRSLRHERKPSSLAIHWRGVRDSTPEALEARIRRAWTPFLGRYDFHIHRFDGGLELRPAGRTKKNAVQDVLEGTSADTPAAYLGDDATDEEAFAGLRPGDLAVLVRDAPRPTMARLRLTPPDELLAFLEGWLGRAQAALDRPREEP